MAVEPWAGADLDELLGAEREVHRHQGNCPQCGVAYQFETNVLRGFSDFIEAFCPRCGASIGTYREDIGVRIDVRVEPAETDEDEIDDDDWADDTDLPGFMGWTDQGTPIQEI
jgi:ribosomal protein S27AE